MPPGAEPISGYVLYRAKREDTKKANVDPALKKKMLDWIVFQADLDNAGAPQPKVKDVVQDSSLNNWSVMQVDTELVSNAYVLTTLAEVS